MQIRPRKRTEAPKDRDKRMLRGRHVRTTRAWIGLTQKDFAKKLFVSQSAVAAWENGTNEPTFAHKQRLRALIKIVCRDLLKGAFR